MTWRTTWRGAREHLEAADQILTEVAHPPADATSLLRDDDASAEPEDAPWVLHVYTEGPLSSDILTLIPKELGTPEAEELEDRDWVAHALEGLGVVRAGPFILYGSHDAEDAAKMDGIKLQVEANQAFGTGHHPTTAGCLDAIGDLRKRAFNKILDIGTGSGVLAIGARKIWPEALVVATDIDTTSVRIARENAMINNADAIVFDVAAGTDADVIRQQAPYDLVFANILAGPLKELSPDISEQTAPGGTVILAGLLDEQEEGVLEAYRSVGFDLAARGGTPRWPVLTLEKKAR